VSTDIDDLDAVRAAVQRYVDACTNADSEALRSALHPAWRMYGIDTSDEEVAVPVDEFVAWVAGRQPPVGYRATITHIEITTDVALATLVEEKYYDTDYIIFFSLVRSGGRWSIVTKTYSSV
jgi:Putative lumazine-binding